MIIIKIRLIKGTNKIGGCITEISTNKSKIIIDFGNDLNTTDKYDIEGLTKGKSSYDAVFITHSHDDHIGRINEINKDIKVYVEKRTLDIYNLTCDFTNTNKVNRTINTFEILNNTKNELKENRLIFNNGDIKVYAYLGDHSAYNSCMFLIEADGKKVLHTGDFRMHGRKNFVIENSLKKIGKVDLLVTEGTTLTRLDKASIKEKELENEITKVMNKYDEVLVMQSSTNLDRTATFLRSSIKTNKKFIIDLLSYHIQNYINRFINIDNENVFLYKPLKYNKKPKEFKETYMNINNTLNGAFQNFTMEVKESMLDDIKMFHAKGLLNKACLIYSMWPGYIDNNSKLKELLKEIESLGIDIYYIHTSGHADIKAFKKLNSITNPNKTIIIHTEDYQKGKDLFNNVIDIKDNKYIEV